YRVVMSVAELDDLIRQHFEEVILDHGPVTEPQPLNNRFQIRAGYLEAVHDKVFERAPFAILEVFVLLAPHPEIKGVRADTIRQARDHRYRIADEFGRDIRSTSASTEVLS